MAKIRIGIIGVGGVGGYYGGMLAKQFHQSELVEIVFVVRPETGLMIEKAGLKIVEDDHETIVNPAEIITNESNCRPLDYLICCTKGYQLEAALNSLSNAITSSTVILPLLNGVNASQIIRRVYPQAEVWEGCVYIVASIISKGVILVKGSNQKLYFGSLTNGNEKHQQFARLLKDAGIVFEHAENIEEIIWKKFVFISSLATITTKLDLSISEVLGNSEHRILVIKMINELMAIAKAKNINLGDDMEVATLNKMDQVPIGSLTSMLRDYRSEKPIELEVLTEFVIQSGRACGVPTPVYNQMYHGILNNLLIKIKNI